MLHIEYKENNYKQSKSLEEYFVKLANDDFLKNFNSEDFSFDKESKGKGVTLESIRVLEIL